MNRKMRRAMKAKGANLSNPTAPNPLEQEYYRLCAQAGETQYRIDVLRDELADLNDQIRELNRKYHESKQEKANEATEAPAA